MGKVSAWGVFGFLIVLSVSVFGEMPEKNSDPTKDKKNERVKAVQPVKGAVGDPVVPAGKRTPGGVSRRSGVELPFPQKAVDAIEARADDFIRKLNSKENKLEDLSKQFSKMRQIEQREVLWQALKLGMGAKPYALKKEDPLSIDTAQEFLVQAKKEIGQGGWFYYSMVMDNLLERAPKENLAKTAELFLKVQGGAETWKVWNHALKKHPDVAADQLYPFFNRYGAFRNLKPESQTFKDLMKLQDSLNTRGKFNGSLSRHLISTADPNALKKVFQSLVGQKGAQSLDEQIAKESFVIELAYYPSAIEALRKNQKQVIAEFSQRMLDPKLNASQRNALANLYKEFDKESFQKTLWEMFDQKGSQQDEAVFRMELSKIDPKKKPKLIEYFLQDKKFRDYVLDPNNSLDRQEPAIRMLKSLAPEKYRKALWENFVKKGPFQKAALMRLSSEGLVKQLSEKQLQVLAKLLLAKKIDEEFLGPYLWALKEKDIQSLLGKEVADGLLQRAFESNDEYVLAQALEHARRNPERVSREQLERVLSWNAKLPKTIYVGGPNGGVSVYSQFPELAKALGPRGETLVKKISEELKKKISYSKRGYLIKALKEIGSPKAYPVYLETLNNPKSHRFDNYYAAQGFGDLLKDPKFLSEKVRKEIKNLLSTRDVARDDARTYVRKYLPVDLQSKLDREVASESVHPSNRNPCEVMCRITDFYRGEIPKMQIKLPVWYRQSNATPFHLATKTLIARFLLESTASCGMKKDKEALIASLFDQKVSEQEKPKQTLQNEWDGLKKNLLDSGLSPEELKQVEKMYQNVGEKLVEAKPQPRNSSYILSVAQLGSLVQSLEKENPKLAPALAPLKKAIARRIIKTFEQRNVITHEKAPDVETKNSLFPAYHYFVNLLGFPGDRQDPEFRKYVELLRQERKENKKRYGEGNRFGYYLNSQYDYLKNNGESKSEKNIRESAQNVLKKGARSSSARAVSAAYALYRLDPKNHAENVEFLIRALGSYDTYFSTNFSGFGEDRTHDRFDDAQPASYFGPSTIYHAIPAAEALLSDKTLSEEQRVQVRDILSSIQTKVLSMFEPNGLFREQSDLFGSAKYYDNAQLGLALVSACRMHQKNKLGVGEQNDSPTPSRPGH